MRMWYGLQVAAVGLMSLDALLERHTGLEAQLRLGDRLRGGTATERGGRVLLTEMRVSNRIIPPFKLRIRWDPQGWADTAFAIGAMCLRLPCGHGGAQVLVAGHLSTQSRRIRYESTSLAGAMVSQPNVPAIGNTRFGVIFQV